MVDLAGVEPASRTPFDQLHTIILLIIQKNTFLVDLFCPPVGQMTFRFCRCGMVKYFMHSFLVYFHDCEPLICNINATDLGNKYYKLLKQQYQTDPIPIFRDPQKYTLCYFRQLADRASQELGWNWHRDCYNWEVTTELHKDIEQYLANGFSHIPAQHDELLHEMHFCLHAIESGSKRNSWLQVEWFNDAGFDITKDQYPRKIVMDFGDLRLQNPHVGHHPLFVWEQNDHTNIKQTCRFHDLARPGINIVIDRNSHQGRFNQQKYVEWWQQYASEFVEIHGIETILAWTGHPVIGHIENLETLEAVVNKPVLEFSHLEFLS